MVVVVLLDIYTTIRTAVVVELPVLVDEECVCYGINTGTEVHGEGTDSPTLGPKCD